MAQNCRFAFAVHVLSVLAGAPTTPFSSDTLADKINTHPVVIRRLLLDLKDAGLVFSARGPGGGARLSRAPSKISLLEIYNAVQGQVALFGEHPNQPSQGCCVGREIQRVLNQVALRAQEAVEAQYRATTLAHIVAEIEKPREI